MPVWVQRSREIHQPDPLDQGSPSKVRDMSRCPSAGVGGTVAVADRAFHCRWEIAKGEQADIEPAIQPRHGNDRVTAGLKDAADLPREVIGVMNVLDGFQADHNVEGSMGEWQRRLAIQIDLAQCKGRVEIDDIRSQHGSDLSPFGKISSQHTIGTTDIEHRTPGGRGYQCQGVRDPFRQLVATVHGTIASPCLVRGTPSITLAATPLGSGWI